MKDATVLARSLLFAVVFYVNTAVFLVLGSWLLALANVVGSVVALHFYRGGREFKVFLGVFAGAVGLYAWAFRGLPPDLGFLPMSWQEASPRTRVPRLLDLLLFHVREPVDELAGRPAAARTGGNE